MTLDEAIEHAKERAIFRDMCGQEHSELANWLEELKELRDKCCKLEKEADWLAEVICKKHSDIRRNGFVPDCPTGRKCDNQCVQCWREAARKAMENNNA